MSVARPARLRWNPNERLGILNGWLVFLGDGFLSVSVVVAGFAARLGAPNAIIGLLPAISAGGWMLPQLLVAARVRSLPYKLPVYRSAALVRMLTYLAMVVIAATLAGQPALCLTLFVLAMLLNALASGVSGLPFLEVVSKIVPPGRRAWFFGTRNLYGGLLAFGAGLVVRWILASGLSFPLNYALIFLLGTVAYTVGYGVFGRVTEPADPPLPPGKVREEVRAIPQTLADRHFRAFLIVRLLLAAASMGDPFYAVYALRDLHYPAATLGTFVMALTGAAPLSNILWQRVAERKGSRRIIRYAAFFAGLAPLLALTVGTLHLPPGAYLLVFILSSVALQGFNLGHTNHLLNLAPADARSRYIGTLNTLVGAALFAPVLGGLLADAAGYRVVFVLSAVLFAAAWWQCGKLRRDA
ncbi:MFS transporter [Deinococcus metallilatus]|uniref:MFS family arabinose efflux permease n=1 Tax=Deinococcus metallilatus TaxID=1211322 RepID=A0AAJ5F2S2_9DEIO|nr:MFS transporter [Deinococcus metallilatus]MBB5297408.1 putative MFS family arabinose efflux permease [Deinococcus metallilatus]QBY08775.1 MFS transporter [Deinococcus metallilatus]RXJ10656.1 MFS transporter [Deinococcus metallilatus]TLK26626.1 MFS transporter [Deinococcus metallilatus]GMA16973.1 MFS transporter [Deinococcus metallilatus]